MIPAVCGSWVGARLLLLFEKTFTRGLAFQRRFCTEPVETVDIQLATSLCVLFESLFTEENGVRMDMPQVELSFLLDKLFFFSYIWSVGAPCGSACWEAFNENAREIFEETCPMLGLPGGGTAFDFFVDVREGRFKEWNDILPTFQYDASLPYFSLVVPTTDTCRFSYVMKSLISVDKPCFITGVTGTHCTHCITASWTVSCT